MQYYKVTAPKGANVEAYEVTFLGIFKPGETKQFSETEIAAWEAMNGVPRDSALADGWKFEKATKAEQTNKPGEEDK